MNIRAYKAEDVNMMIEIWNEIVEEGIAFPQEDFLDGESGSAFFNSQSYCGVACDDIGNILGLYILHPNNIGRCAHISNASYAVSSKFRGNHIGEKLVLDSLHQAKRFGFKIMQFNAVVATNIRARHLYERLGFKQLGIIPHGFRLKNKEYVDICPYFKEIV